MKWKRTSRLIGFGACVLAFGLCKWASRGLIGRSTWVMNIGYTQTINVRYWWLSEDKLLVVRYTPGMDSFTPDRGHFLLYDLATGSETPLPALDPALSTNKRSVDDMKLDRGMLLSNGKSWPLPFTSTANPQPAAYGIISGPQVCPESEEPQAVVEVKPNGSRASQSFRIDLPEHRWPTDVAYSPNGKRIAWAFKCPDSRSISEYLNPWGATFIIYVSDIDGAHMHELGRVSDSEGMMSDCSDYSISLRWLPGDRKLSYSSYGTLYVTPAL